MELRDFLAQCLWQDQFRLRTWATAKEWQKKQAYKRADEALKRSGVKNGALEVKDAKGLER